jgi:O-antigen/teichoic acid export membrane protein
MSTDLPTISEADIVEGSGVVVAPPQPEPPATARRSMLYLVCALVGGNLIGKLLRMVGGILQARCVTPEVLGLFNLIGLVLGYLPFLQLGILNGVNRELPYFIGKGDKKRVMELVAAAQAWALLLSGAVSVCLFGVAIMELVRGEMWLAAGWTANAFLAMAMFYNTYYLQMTYRTSHDFARLAMAGVVENVVGLVAVVFVALLSFYGLCVRAVLVAAVSTAFLFYWRPVRVWPAWDGRQLKHLLIIGAPIFVVGQLYSWWTVLDSTLVVWYAGTEALGLYALVVMAGSTMDMLPQAVGHVLYPRMAEQYGRTGVLGNLVRMSILPTIITVVSMALMVAVGWWLVDPVVQLLLPRYVKAVPAVQWSLLLSVVASFEIMLSVYNVVRRQDLYTVALVLGMAAYFGALVWLTRGGVSLVAFPQAMLIGRAVFIGTGCVLLISLARKKHATK